MVSEHQLEILEALLAPVRTDDLLTIALLKGLIKKNRTWIYLPLMMSL